MANVTSEDMRRVTLTFTLDQALLEVEGKHATSNRLYNGAVRGAAAARLFQAIADRLAEGVANTSLIQLRVNDNFEILPDQ